MKKTLSIILTFTLLLCVGCSSTSTKVNNFTNDQWIEDVNYLNQTIVSSHPDPFRFVSEDDWNIAIDKLLNEIPKLSDLEITFGISTLLSLLKDGHTEMELTSAVSTINNTSGNAVLYFPLIYKWFGDEFRVFVCDSQYKDLLGYELISINGIKRDEILNKIYSILQYDNFQDAKQRAGEKGSNYELLKYFGIVNSESATYTFKDNNGKYIERKIIAKPIETTDFIELKSIANPVPKTYIKPLDVSDYYWYRSFTEDNILYFQYNSCLGKDTGYVPGEQYRDSYPEFFPVVDDLVDEVNNASFDKFIIDLRNNRGGSLGATNNLITKLENKTDLSNKKLYVLTSKKTFSAGTSSVIDIKNHFDATVIGEETGGNTNFTTVNPNNAFNLPNSNLEIKLSSSTLDKIPGYEGGFKPDIYLEESYDDFINGIDTYYEYIKNDK